MHTISQSLSEHTSAMGIAEAPPDEASLPMRWLRTLLRLWRVRQTLQTLAELDDAILKDIGLTRADLREGRKPPLAADLAAAFEHRRAARAFSAGTEQYDRHQTIRCVVRVSKASQGQK